MLYFGVLTELLGQSGDAAELPEGTTVGELLRILRMRTSNDAKGGTAGDGMVERLWQSLAVAVNRAYCSSPRAVLRDGDEVALLPPVSGGAGER